MNRRILLSCFLGILALTLIYATTEPTTNIDPAKHPNLAKAQTLITDAFDKIVAAQKANEFDLGGHAAKAKTALEEASKHLKMAAVDANKSAGSNQEATAAQEQKAEANQPTESVSETKHPNLAKAQEYIDLAYARIVDAQKANDFDMKGHAAKAKDQLELASKELKLAAAEANH